MKQRFTSKQTSINSTKAPAVYSMKRAVNVMTGKTVVDIGGGRFDTAAEAARVYGAAVSIYDPFNRTPEHNAAVLAGSYDVAVISNVLNVIDSEAARGDVVRLAATKAAALLITVYEGDGSAQADRQPPTVGKKTGAPLIIWTKSPPLSRVGMLPGLVV